MSETTETTVADPAEMQASDFGPKKRRYGRVTLDDGRKVLFQSLSSSELAEWDAGCLNDEGRVDKELLRAQQPKLLAKVIVDKLGHRLFSDSEWQILANTDSAITAPLMHAVRKHVGLDRRIDAEKN